jgi:hypothetical protein
MPYSTKLKEANLSVFVTLGMALKSECQLLNSLIAPQIIPRR